MTLHNCGLFYISKLCCPLQRAAAKEEDDVVGTQSHHVPVLLWSRAFVTGTDGIAQNWV